MSDNHENNVVPISQRDANGRFTKGASANSAGRSARSPKTQDDDGRTFTVQEVFAANALTVVLELYNLIRAKDTPASTRLAACREWNDRAFGRAGIPALVKDAATGEDIALNLESLSIEAMRELVAARRNPGA